jgi:hypothetical protein
LPSEVDLLKLGIRNLRGAGNVSRMDELVRCIKELPDLHTQRECAQDLQKWLQNNRLWNKKNHVEKDWHKWLKEILQ